MNAEQEQAIRDKLVELRADRDTLNDQIDTLVAEKTGHQQTKATINELIDLLKVGLE